MITVRATGAKETQFGPAEWLRVIHEANRIDPGIFLEPSSTGIRDRGYVEEYPDARVILDVNGDGEVTPDAAATIESKTTRGASTLRMAARHLGLVAT